MSFDNFVICSLIIFYALFIGRAITLKQRGIQVFTLVKDKMTFNAFLESLLFPGLLVWTGALLLKSLGISNKHWVGLLLQDAVNISVYFRTLGAALIVAGLIIFVMALYTFGNSWRVGIDENNAGELITNGIFSRSRNPIFLFMDIYFVGVALIYPGYFFILAALLVVPLIHYQVLHEEQFLEQHYANKYLNYKSRVRRYL